MKLDSRESKMLRRYTYCWFLTFPILLLFGLAFFVKRKTSWLPSPIQKIVLAPFALMSALTNIIYNHTAAVFIFQEWPPVGVFTSERLEHYYKTGKNPRLRKHMSRLVKSFDPDHFTFMDDL